MQELPKHPDHVIAFLLSNEFFNLEQLSGAEDPKWWIAGDSLSSSEMDFIRKLIQQQDAKVEQVARSAKHQAQLFPGSVVLEGVTILPAQL